MKEYLGKIEFKNNYTNFRPLMEIDNDRNTNEIYLIELNQDSNEFGTYGTITIKGDYYNSFYTPFEENSYFIFLLESDYLSKINSGQGFF